MAIWIYVQILEIHFRQAAVRAVECGFVLVVVSEVLLCGRASSRIGGSGRKEGVCDGEVIAHSAVRR